jgi:hypothetical protein
MFAMTQAVFQMPVRWLMSDQSETPQLDTDGSA